MARREATSKKPDDIRVVQRTDPPPPPRIALSIPEFCVSFGISEDFFYKLKRQGKTYDQIRAELPVSKNRIWTVCRAAGLTSELPPEKRKPKKGEGGAQAAP